MSRTQDNQGRSVATTMSRTITASKQLRPWRPMTAGACCTAEGQVALVGVGATQGRTGSRLGGCRPTRSELVRKVAEVGSRPFRRLGTSHSTDLSSMASSSSTRFAAEDLAVLGAGLHAFQLSELRAITHNFSPDYLLGEGGFGTVHKGYLDEKMRPGLKAQPVAVKLLDIEGLQGHREWLAEVIFLGQLRHPHLVKLIGYCCEDEERLLVYEFMPRGSMENHLFRRGGSISLTWGTRLKIALGAARGLAFLHGLEKPVIYRDFKTSNILLDADYTAKLSDFGLAKMGPLGEETHVTTRVMGTQGYAAPEYVMTGHLTAKNDVYSFGVVLLELLTGRRSVDKTKPKAEQKLVDWTRPYLTSSRKLRFIMDPRLGGQYSVRGAKAAAALAVQCTSPHPKDRPRMPAVVEALERVMQYNKDMAIAVGLWQPGVVVAGRNAVAAKVRADVRGRGGRQGAVATAVFSGGGRGKSV